MHPVDVTEVESALGFRLALVTNDQRLPGQTPYRLVVLCPIGPFNCIFKVRDQDGNVVYSHRLFGRREPRDTASWVAVCAPVENLAMAFHFAKENLDEDEAAQRGARVDPDLPHVELPCLECQKTSLHRRSYFEMADEVVCDHCGARTVGETYSRL